MDDALASAIAAIVVALSQLVRAWWKMRRHRAGKLRERRGDLEE